MTRPGAPHNVLGRDGIAPVTAKKTGDFASFMNDIAQVPYSGAVIQENHAASTLRGAAGEILDFLRRGSFLTGEVFQSKFAVAVFEI